MTTGTLGSNGVKRRRSRRFAPMSEINVTPFVDVMLVLLIIFMVAAPLLTVGVPVDLPKANAGALNSDSRPITISIKADGRIFMQEIEIPLDEIAPKLSAIARNGYDERIYVRGDSTAAYGAVIRVVAKISGAGYKKIGIVTLQEKDQ